jgi:hypothetical protein
MLRDPTWKYTAYNNTTYGVMEFHYSITPYVGHMFKILIYGLNTYIN